MFRSYRSILYTFAGLIPLCCGIGFGLLQQERYRQEADHRASNYASYAAEQIRQRCGTLPATQKPQCFHDGQTEYNLQTNDNQREYADLVAQETSALWTSIMGVAALLGMLLSAIGVLLVWTTFQETKRTNLIAMRENARSTRRAIAGSNETASALEIALENAKTAARTAHASEEANRVAEKARRPWVGIKTLKWDRLIDGRYALQFTYTNSGQTPAVVSTATNIIICPNIHSLPWQLEASDLGVSLLLPGGLINNLGVFEFDQEDMDLVQSGSKDMWFQTMAQYRDVDTNREYVTKATYKLDPTDGIPKSHWSVNEAT